MDIFIEKIPWSKNKICIILQHTMLGLVLLHCYLTDIFSVYLKIALKKLNTI